MVPAALRRLGTLGLIALWVLVSGGLLLLLALSVQNSVQYSKLQAWILLINAIAVVTVSVLLARKIIELVRAFRAQVPGSRLTARTVAIFGSLVIAPLIIVYLFSLEFLNRGIDSWFKVEIKQGLTDALELSKAAMDVRMREYARSTELFASKLADSPNTNWALATDAQRTDSGALEVVVYGALGQVLAASSAGPTSTSLPHYATPEMTRAIAGGNTVLEPGTTVGRRLPDQHRGTYRGCAGIERRSLRGGALPGAATARAIVRSRATLLFAARRTVCAARAREEQLSHDPHAGAAAGHADRHIWCYLLRREAHASGAGPDRGHARRGQGRLRHAPAAAVARRDGLPGALVQRHDQAPAARARGDHAQPAGGGARTRTAVDHPGAPDHRRHRHRARPGVAQRQPRGQQHSRRRPRAGHRPAAGGAGRRESALTRASSAK